MEEATRRAGSLPMSNETRGKAIHERRIALGYDSEAAFARATGVDRGSIRRAEAGVASERTYDRLELWLDRDEARTSASVPSLESGLVEFDLTIAPGARAVVKGPVADAARLRHELVELIREVRAELHIGEDEQG